VNHPCHQCGAEVDQGSPFCRKCGAPQIRVSRGDEPQPVTVAAPDIAAGGFAVSEGPAPGGIDKSVARRQALRAGISIAFLLFGATFFPVAALLIPLGGMLAVQLYSRAVPGRKIPLGSGVGIGLLSGFIGFVIFSVFALPLAIWTIALHPDPETLQQIRTQAESSMRSNPNPQAQQMLQSLLTPNGLIIICLILFVLLLILTLVLSALGGVIGASIARRRP
jgi:hypothetical protein